MKATLVVWMGCLLVGCGSGATGAAQPQATTADFDNWQGSYAGTVTWDCGSFGPRQGTLEGDLTLAVSAGDVATMDVESTVTGSCSGQDEGSLTTPLQMVGNKTASGFEFSSFLGAEGLLMITVVGDRGSAEFSGMAPGGATVEVSLEIGAQPEAPES